MNDIQIKGSAFGTVTVSQMFKRLLIEQTGGTGSNRRLVGDVIVLDSREQVRQLITALLTLPEMGEDDVR